MVRGIDLAPPPSVGLRLMGAAARALLGSEARAPAARRLSREGLAVARPPARACLRPRRLPRRLLQVCVLAAAATAATSAGDAVASAAQAAARKVDADVAYIWPLVLWQVPLFDTGAGDHAELYKRLAHVASGTHKKYLTTILPQEFEADPGFKATYEDFDGDHENRAFLRWQKRVWSKLSQTPVEEINWDGERVPMYPGLPYHWKAWHDSEDLRAVHDRIRQACSRFSNYLERSQKNNMYKIFLWAEVFKSGQFQHAHWHTGAAVAGFVPLRLSESKPDDEGVGGGQVQELLIHDPRGEVPPFGQTHRVRPSVGELVLFPAWATHRWLANPAKGSNVILNFLAWPPEGASMFDWEDDPAGDFKLRSVVKVPERQVAAPARGPSSASPARTEL